MKKWYLEPSLILVELTEDVITASVVNLDDGDWGVKDGFVRQ